MTQNFLGQLSEGTEILMILSEILFAIMITVFESLMAGVLVTLALKFLFRLDWVFALMLGSIANGKAGGGVDINDIVIGLAFLARENSCRLWFSGRNDGESHKMWWLFLGVWWWSGNS